VGNSAEIQQEEVSHIIVVWNHKTSDRKEEKWQVNLLVLKGIHDHSDVCF
jgi:hypothetical protein